MTKTAHERLSVPPSRFHDPTFAFLCRANHSCASRRRHATLSGSSRSRFRFSSSALAAWAFLAAAASCCSCRLSSSAACVASGSLFLRSRALSALRRVASAAVVAALRFSSSTRRTLSLAHQVLRSLSLSSIFLWSS